MASPGISEAHLFVYEKSALHHHQNDDDPDNLTAADFTLSFIATADFLGVRIKIADEVPRGTLIADVAVMYDWDRPATPDDDLDSFAREVAIPQVLDCASTTLCDAARSVGARAQFYGVGVIDRLLDEFDSRKESLSELLARSQAKAAAKHAESSDNQV